ncbi:hypothetical protein [Clostridium tagluense]|uniref:hypothetical protein n=1 Tax=Clostridium tagluense TaxID=360422 RepID=UPI001CF3C597|nr:hypothetical protein [Clostridium tagluense]MCB2299212.1 hypothetical protein [Clostridium tagluense]
MNIWFNVDIYDKIGSEGELNKIRILSKVGFGGNIVLFICSILIIVGFDIIP